MPKITIKKKDLPPADSHGATTIRLRVVADSRNAMSKWSQVYRVFPPIISPDDVDDANFYDQGRASSISVVSTKTSTDKWKVAVTWVDNYELPQYDVYVRWYTTTWGVWTFVDSVAARSITFDSPLTSVPTKFEVAVTRSTYTKSYVLDGVSTRTPITIFNTVGVVHTLG